MPGTLPSEPLLRAYPSPLVGSLPKLTAAVRREQTGQAGSPTLVGGRESHRDLRPLCTTVHVPDTGLAEFHKQRWVRSLPIMASFPVCTEYVSGNIFDSRSPSSLLPLWSHLLPSLVWECGVTVSCCWLLGLFSTNSQRDHKTGASLLSSGLLRASHLPPSKRQSPYQEAKARVLWLSVTRLLFLCSHAPFTLLKPHSLNVSSTSPPQGLCTSVAWTAPRQQDSFPPSLSSLFTQPKIELCSNHPLPNTFLPFPFSLFLLSACHFLTFRSCWLNDCSEMRAS